MPAPQPQPQAPSGRQRRFDRRWLAAIAAIVLLLLAFGTCGLIAQAATTLTVTPDRAARGDTVTVKATHVPANKAGQIQLWSVLRTFPFQADSKGDVTVYMTIPREIALGDHTVKICWDNSCHKSAPLVVVAALGEVFPTPVANQTPGTGPTAQPSATPSQASGSTPQPTSTPGGSQPTARPTTPPPTAPPTAPPNPCPGNSNPATLSPATQSVLVAGGTASFTGSNFTPNSSVTMSYYAPSGSSTPARTWSVTASCTGSFSTSTPTKTNSGLVLRNDKVVACDIKKGCVSATISVAVGL